MGGVSCLSSHIQALVHGLGSIRSFCSLTHRVCISMFPPVWVKSFLLVAFWMSRSVDGTFSLLDSHSFVPYVDERFFGQTRFSCFGDRTCTSSVFRPLTFVFRASSLEHVRCIVLLLSLRMSSVSPCCCCFFFLTHSLVPSFFFLARGHDGLFPFVRFVRTSMHAHVWIPCSHPRRVGMFRTSTCGGLLSLHVFGWTCCVQWFVLHPAKVGGKDGSCPVGVASATQGMANSKQTNWGRTCPRFLHERKRRGNAQARGCGTGMDGHPSIDGFAKTFPGWWKGPNHGLPKGSMGNASQQEREREDKAGNPAPTIHSNRNQRNEKNHSRDETDTTSVTTRERNQHE